MDPEKGWIVDFHDLETIVRQSAIDKIDHTNLNDTLPNPTTENLAMWLYERIAGPLQDIGATISRIDIQEGEDCWCTLRVPL